MTAIVTRMRAQARSKPLTVMPSDLDWSRTIRKSSAVLAACGMIFTSERVLVQGKGEEKIKGGFVPPSQIQDGPMQH